MKGGPKLSLRLFLHQALQISARSLGTNLWEKKDGV